MKSFREFIGEDGAGGFGGAMGATASAASNPGSSAVPTTNTRGVSGTGDDNTTVPVSKKRQQQIVKSTRPSTPSLHARAIRTREVKTEETSPRKIETVVGFKEFEKKTGVKGGNQTVPPESFMTKEDSDPCWKGYEMVGMKKKGKKEVPNCVPANEETLLERGADSKGYYRSTESGAGLTRKGAEHFGVHTAVTAKHVDPDSKSGKRRKSFCARMSGMPGPMKDDKGRPTRKAMSLRRWRCHEETKPEQKELVKANAQTEKNPTGFATQSKENNLVKNIENDLVKPNKKR